MKNLHLITLFLLSLTFFICCDIENEQDTPQIEINTPDVLFTNNGGNNTISFSSTVAWTAEVVDTRSDGWCSIHPTSGTAGDATITITTEPNDTPDDRSASIVINAGTASQTLIVNQKQKDAIVISDNYISIGQEGETIEVKVNTNIDFNVHIPSEVNWIHQIDSRSLSVKSLLFEVSPNTNVLSRNATITINSKDNTLSESLTIIQQSNRTELKVAYSTKIEELEEWSEGLFSGEGTYILGKQYSNNGYLMTIGNILEDKSAIIFLDQTKQIRELFIDNIVFAFEYNEGVDISIIESGNEIVTEHINWNSPNLETRTANDHGQQIGIINLISNLQGMYDAIKEIGGAKGFSKKGTIMYLANQTDALRNSIMALGGPDVFNETFSNWLGTGMNIANLAELAGMYGSSGLLNPISACIFAYTGLYARYLELYDEYINIYFDNCQAEIDRITSERNTLNIGVEISGHEPWYNNIECGVIVQEKSSSDPRYSEGVPTQTVTQNGNYTFTESGIKINTTYSCRPFVIDKNRVSLWKGFIGKKVGPLVRYGKTKDVEVNCSVSTGDYVSVTENSAIVKCSYTNVLGLECGVYISSEEETRKVSANSIDGEQQINISGLLPGTTYNYWAFINVDGIPVNGQVKSFTTELPDVSGTWTCKETHTKSNGEVYYETYTVTLHKDGTATTSKYDSYYSARWSRSKTNLFVRIDIIATQYSNTGYNLSIVFDDPTNPTSGKGYAEQWAYSGMTGGSSSHSFKLEMTK